MRVQPDDVNQIMRRLLKSMRSNPTLFSNIQPVLHAKVPIICSKHRQYQIDIDISLHNVLVNPLFSRCRRRSSNG
jgi:hypothetical protein